MATQWYFELGDDEMGPVSFQDLVDLVRAGVLSEDAMVRASWKTTAQRANSVIGLIYMAQRPAATPDAPAAVSSPEPVAAAPDQPADGIEPPRPEWLERLLEMGPALHVTHAETYVTQPDTEPNSTGVADDPFSDTSIPPEPDADQPSVADDLAARNLTASGNSSAWTSTMEAALSQVDSRRPTTTQRRRGRLWQACAAMGSVLRQAAQSREFIAQAFRIGSAIVVANLAAFGIDSWSQRQALRFPTRPGQTQAATSEFPLIGKCSSTEYTVLVVH